MMKILKIKDWLKEKKNAIIIKKAILNFDLNKAICELDEELKKEFGKDFRE